MPVLPQRPLPRSDEDRHRWEHTDLRHRLQDGEWREDLVDELRMFFSATVLARITHPDMSIDPFRSATKQTAILYDEQPTVAVVEEVGDPTIGAEGLVWPSGDRAGPPPDLSPIVTPRLWPIRQHAHWRCVGMNEAAVRVDWQDGAVDYRAVLPNSLVCESSAERPDVPVYVEELRIRHPSPGVCEWVWDVWDLRDPKDPKFRIELPEQKEGDAREDVTSRYYPAAGTWPYVDTSGVPILPYVLYHLEVGGTLWRYAEGRELVEGTLKVGCLRTMWLHGVRDVSWPQRNAVDLELAGASNAGPGGAEADRVEVDPSSILVWRTRDGAPSGSLVTMEAACDPARDGEAIDAYVRSLYADAGIGSADTQKGGSTGMSGYAIVVSRDALRRSQRRQIPACRIGDQQLLSIAARLSNKYGGTSLPERPEDYTITYQGLPASLEETRAAVERVQALRAAGLMSRVDAMIEINPFLTPDAARAKLAEIDAEGRPAPAPTPPGLPSSGASPSAGRAAMPHEPSPQDPENGGRSHTES